MIRLFLVVALILAAAACDRQPAAKPKYKTGEVVHLVMGNRPAHVIFVWGCRSGQCLYDVRVFVPHYAPVTIDGMREWELNPAE